MMVSFFFCIVLTKTLVQRHVLSEKIVPFFFKIYLVSVHVHVCSCTPVCRSPKRPEKNATSFRMADTAAWEHLDIGARNLTYVS